MPAQSSGTLLLSSFFNCLSTFRFLFFIFFSFFLSHIVQVPCSYLCLWLHLYHGILILCSTSSPLLNVFFTFACEMKKTCRPNLVYERWCCILFELQASPLIPYSLSSSSVLSSLSCSSSPRPLFLRWERKTCLWPRLFFAKRWCEDESGSRNTHKCTSCVQMEHPEVERRRGKNTVWSALLSTLGGGEAEKISDSEIASELKRVRTSERVRKWEKGWKYYAIWISSTKRLKKRKRTR